MPDVFPPNLIEDIRQLQRDVEEIKALLRTQPGKTTASQGWVFPNLTAPDTSSLPAGAVQIYGRGGLPRFKAAGSSTEVTISPPVVLSDIGAIATADAGATYTPLVQQLINELKQWITSFRAEAQDEGLMQ